MSDESVPVTRKITAGAGLSGGGSLNVDRTISLTKVTPAGSGPIAVADAYGRVVSFKDLTKEDIEKALGRPVITSGGVVNVDEGKVLSAKNTMTLDGDPEAFITFQGTDTYVGRETTDTFKNKTFDTKDDVNVFLLNGTKLTDTTGKGKVVLDTGAELVKPKLGDAKADTINGLTISRTTGTLTMVDSTLIVHNSIALSGRDKSALNIGDGGKLGAAAFKDIGTFGEKIPLLSGKNQWAEIQSMPKIVLNEPLDVENGGTGDKGTSWVSYQPMVTARLGEIGSYTALGRYKIIGKTAFIWVKVVIVDSRSANGGLSITLPPDLVTATETGISGRDSTGRMVQAFGDAKVDHFVTLLYDGSHPEKDFVLNGVVEIL